MKKTLPLSLMIFSFLLFGCSKHQFVFVEGQQDYSYTNDFVIENDSVTIRYDFSGPNIPVNIKIFNKSQKPIYVDWKKSVAIIDGKRYNYWNDNITFEHSGSSFHGFTNSSFYGEGVLIKDERISFIPPNAFIETTRIMLQTVLFENLPLHNRQRLSFETEYGPVQAKKYTFSEVNSPLIFRSILTLSAKESFNDETHFETDFWVSEIVESPKNLLLLHQTNQNNIGVNNTSMIKKITGFGAAAKTAALLGVTTGLILLSPEGTIE